MPMAASDVTEGPVLNLINKRLRALRKKFNRILQMEESIAQGKTINKEQEEVLRSKPAVVAVIDELEKLRQPLSAAVQEELSLSVEERQLSHLTEPLNGQKNQPPPPPPASPDSNQDSETHVDHSALVLEDLLNLIYFGSLFDMESKNDFTSPLKTLERNCCLSYDYVTDDATDPLSEKDLDLISMLSGLMISRPPNSTLPHKDALQRCIEHAKLWLEKSEQQIDHNNNVTYAGLRERLNKILSSEYLIITPLDTPIELAAAAAVNYAHFPGEVESSVPQFLHQEAAANCQEETADHYNPEQENQKDEEETEHVEFVFQEQIQPQAGMEQNQKDVDSKEHQYYPRRSHQNQRGGRGGIGGRRGYSNSREGRNGNRGNGYQNGRQYYEQTGNYHPRPHYYRGRGGSGGGYNQNNHISGGQGSQMTADGVHS